MYLLVVPYMDRLDLSTVCCIVDFVYHSLPEWHLCQCMLIVHLGDTQCDSPSWEAVGSRWITVDYIRARPNVYTKLGKNLKTNPLNKREVVYMTIFYLISPSSAGSELQEIYFLMDKKTCKNSSNMPQDIFRIDPTQIKAKTSKENFSYGTSSTVLQLCEIQVMNDKQSFGLAPTFYFCIHPSQGEGIGHTASK